MVWIERAVAACFGPCLRPSRGQECDAILGVVLHECVKVLQVLCNVHETHAILQILVLLCCELRVFVLVMLYYSAVVAVPLLIVAGGLLRGRFRGLLFRVAAVVVSTVTAAVSSAFSASCASAEINRGGH